MKTGRSKHTNILSHAPPTHHHHRQVWDIFTTAHLDQIQRRMTTGALPSDNVSSLGLSRCIYFFYNLPFFKNGYILYVATFSPQHPQFCVIAEKLIRSTSVGTESVLGAPPSGPTGADNGITKTEFVNMVLQVISLSPSLLYS